ncbi:hypothetical protein JCM8547_003584 [Rhodosporidiobolus lusitaniae]
MRSYTTLAVLASLVALSTAKVYIYKPVEASHYKAGDSFTVSWKDDGETPSWTAWGASSVGLYTGSATSQTLLTTLGTVNDPAADHELRITIDPSWGPNSSEYFMRVQSDAGTDSTGAPLQAFSARFELSEMTGEWSAEVQAQLDGSAVVSSSGSATTTATASTTTSGMATATRSPAAATGSASSASLAGANLASRVASTSSVAASASTLHNATSSAGLERVVGGGAVAFAAVALAALV